MSKLKNRRKTAFVPRIVFRVALGGGAAVVPICVTLGLSAGGAACGDGVQFTVAAECLADGAQV